MVGPSKTSTSPRSEPFKSSVLGETTPEALRQARPAEETLRARVAERAQHVEQESYEDGRESAGDRRRGRDGAAPLPNVPALHREGMITDAKQQPVLSLQGVSAAALTRTPVASPSWHAFDSPGDASADTGIAVSSTHVVVTTRTTVGFFTKAGVRLREPFQINDLFGAAVMSGLGVTGIFDSRSIFDPFRKRFWVATLANNGKPPGDPASVHHVLMAVSRTENPMDGWFLHFWQSGWDATDNHDYLALGVSSKCFVQTNSAGNASGGYHNVCFGDAGAMAAGLNGNACRVSGLANSATGNIPDFVQPVSHHDHTSAGLLLAGRDGNNIVVWRVANPLAPGQAITDTAYPVAPFAVPQAAPQPGGVKPIWFGQLGNFILKAAHRGFRLYVVTNDARNWFGDAEAMTSIRVLRINTFPLPGNRVEIDRVFGCNSGFDDKPTDRVYYGFPAIEVTSEGHMVMVYSRSGTTVSPEARISAWQASGPDVLPSRLLRKGEKPYQVSWADPWGVYPWADLAGASVDPADGRHVWVATCYATGAADNNWGVWVGRVGLGGTPYYGAGVAAVGMELV